MLDRYFVTCPKGIEQLLAEELREIGITPREVGPGGVSFEGGLEQAYQVCIWSRLANRVLLQLRTFQAENPDQLYHGVRAIHWTDHITPDQTLAVDFTSTHSAITHTHFGALKTKDAIVDQLRAILGTRPSVDPVRPDLRVNVHLNQNKATVSIDLSGESLHRRGYRESNTEAPIKENIAAALVRFTGWPRDGSFAFLDPMCGSGTLLFEAAGIFFRHAPGLDRTRFGFTKWLGHVPKVWKRVQDEALEKEIRDPQQLSLRTFPKIVGYDRDGRVVRLALGNSQRAGYDKVIHIEKRDLSACEPIAEKGIFLTNPPYGERMGLTQDLSALYRSIGDLMKQKFKGWNGYVFTGNLQLAKSIGLKAAKRHVLYNGPIECRLLEFPLY